MGGGVIRLLGKFDAEHSVSWPGGLHFVLNAIFEQGVELASAVAHQINKVPFAGRDNQSGFAQAGDLVIHLAHSAHGGEVAQVGENVAATQAPQLYRSHAGVCS